DYNLTAHVPYIFPPPGTDPICIADGIRARQTNCTLLDLDGVLLNASTFTQAHSNLFGVIRSNNSIPGAMRELILSVTTLNNCSYVWSVQSFTRIKLLFTSFRLQHEPVAQMEGLTTEQLLVIRLAPPLVAAMDLTDWMTQNIRVPDTVFDAMRPFLNDSQLVEAVSTAVGYIGGSRLIGLECG
ncbi:hypothetical protein DFH08DRAFT_717450, partial [Mycena albidolilacea]